MDLETETLDQETMTGIDQWEVMLIIHQHHHLVVEIETPDLETTMSSHRMMLTFDEEAREIAHLRQQIENLVSTIQMIATFDPTVDLPFEEDMVVVVAGAMEVVAGAMEAAVLQDDMIGIDLNKSDHDKWSLNKSLDAPLYGRYS
jgi:hypothetical protein